jgi:PAS domain S-box-containing protein
MNRLKRFPPSLFLRRVSSFWGGLAWSLAFLAVMFWLRYSLNSLFVHQFPYLTFFLGVILSSMFVGWQSATLVMIVGYFLAERFFISGNWLPTDAFSTLGASFYFLTNSVIIAYAEAAHRGLRQADRITTELEQISERYRLATEAMQGMVYEWDVVTQRVERSAGLTQILGYASGEDEPTGQWWSERVHPDDIQRADALLRRLETDQERTYEVEYRVRDKQGNYHWVSEKSLILRDNAGKIARIIGCTVDISERKAAQDALQHRTVEVEQLNVRLKRAIRETHHRVKNNLQVIAALTDIPLEFGAKTVAADDLRRIGQHVRTLAAIHDILTQNVNENAELETISTLEVLDKLISLIRTTLPDRAVEYQAVAADLPIPQGASLALLVSELISNSIKHGEGTIWVSLARQEADANAPESLILTVKDEGQGFPADFNPLAAANTGLDLIDSLARYDLQGTLQFGNSPSGGAAVTVQFPIPSPAPVPDFLPPAETLSLP